MYNTQTIEKFVYEPRPTIRAAIASIKVGEALRFDRSRHNYIRVIASTLSAAGRVYKTKSDFENNEVIVYRVK
jgi:hypothetical protein